MSDLESPSVVRYFGEYGSFTCEVAIGLFPDDLSILRGHDEVGDMVEALKSDPKAVGVLPMENSTTKLVGDSADALFSGELEIIGEARKIIRLAMLGFARSVQEVREVRSHYKALKQAERYLRDKSIKQVKTDSTSQGVRQVVEAGMPEIAGLGSPDLAKKYKRQGLRVIEEDVADTRPNSTRFVVVRALDPNRPPGLEGLEFKDRTLARVTALVGPPNEAAKKRRVQNGSGNGVPELFTSILNDHHIKQALVESRPVAGLDDFFGDRVFLTEMLTERGNLARLARDKRVPNNMSLQILGIFPPTRLLDNN